MSFNLLNGKFLSFCLEYFFLDVGLFLLIDLLTEILMVFLTICQGINVA